MKDIYQIHEIVEVLIKHLPVLLSKYNELKTKENRTSQEDILLKKLEVRMSQYLPYINYYKNFFRSSGHKGAIAFYYCVKEHANAGNVEAKRILKEVKPLFRRALTKQMSVN